MHRQQLALTALTMICVLSGCDLIGAPQPPWLNLSPPQRPSYSYAARRHIRVSEHSRSARTGYSESASRAPAQSDLAPPPAVNSAERAATPSTAVSAAPITLSLAGDSGDRQRAQHLLQVTDANLMRARSRHLSAAEQETYQRASQLASRARRALADNDCAAASSLAGKASSLAAGLSGE